MKRPSIRQAAVLGAGVMGSRIAALLAGADIPTYLLDMVPRDLDDRDIKKGLDRESPGFRNKLALQGIDGTLMASPPAIFAAEDAKLIKPGNFDDHLSWLTNADWIIEVVAEDLAIKKQLLARIAPYVGPDAILSTNTSGISIDRICEDLPKNLRSRFLGTHFFNPPRHLKLLEIIPGKSTSKNVVTFMSHFCEDRLGKSIVFAKDTPNFIANRIGSHALISAMKEMMKEGMTVEEVDAITGPIMGRPRSATFRTADMVGLDTVMKVARNVAENVSDKAEKEAFTLPPFMAKMVENGLLGDKSQKGFYKKTVTMEGSQVHAMDYGKLDYVPQRKPQLALLKELDKIDDLPERMRSLVYSEDRAGRFAWNATKRMLLYCAERVPEVSDDIVNIDRAMRWGFNWELGPFETWDAIGLKQSVERMKREGEKIPANITRMLSQGYDRFYRQLNGKKSYYNFATSSYLDLPDNRKIIMLPALKARNRVVLSNAGASLIDMGDGVACLEFHSPNNAIDGDVIQMINDAVEMVENKFEGMVIGNHGVNFCVGADVKQISGLVQNKDWKTLELAVSSFQDACMRIKYCQKPVVAAPFRMTLGGGCEVCLAASRIRGFAESYMGLVEMGVGVIPAGGGTKEMLFRATDQIPETVPSAVPGGGQTDFIPYVARIFEMIATAKVSTSTREAQKLGFMHPRDGTSMSLDYLLHDAKLCVLHLAREGYHPPRPRNEIRIVGRTGRAILELMVFLMQDAGYITENDSRIAKKLAYVLTGGDLDQHTLVTERYLLDLERETFLSLCGEEGTRARLKHFADTNKPLRN